jgi:glycogen(starch) synthase
LLTTDVVGGVWDFCLALAGELATQHAARVTLLVLGEPSAAQSKQADDVHAQLIAEPLRLEWMQHGQVDMLRTRQLIARLVHQLQPDVLHANQFASACAPVDVPVVLTLHSDVLTWRRWTLGSMATPPEWSDYKALVRQALTRADRVVAVSGFLADETRSIYGCGHEISVIHNGWAAKPVGGGSTRGPITLLAGRAWDAAKNVGLAVKAAEGWSPGPVFLAGEQASPDSSECFEAPLPLQALGYLPHAELNAVLQSALVYLSPARYDPFGLLPLQAALNGCALLLSDIPSYRELWDGAAEFFHSNDAGDLRRHWSRLIDAPDLALDLASRSRQRAIERYSAARMADAYLDVYGAVSLRHGAVAV